MAVAVQLSIYPLGQEHLSPAINRALAIFGQYGLSVTPGTMSSVISGEDGAVFGALKEVYQALAGQGGLVMVATFSNACPV